MLHSARSTNRNYLERERVVCERNERSDIIASSYLTIVLDNNASLPARIRKVVLTQIHTNTTQKGCYYRDIISVMTTSSVCERNFCCQIHAELYTFIVSSS